jgi:hypothetical protein
MNMLKLPEKFENTKLAYITEGERKLLRRRDAVRGKKSPEYSKDGVPVLRSAAEIEAEGVAKEVAANKRMKTPGFAGDAAAYERDANIRSIEAGFTSAVDQEIDANRRARAAGFKNAALKENPAVAAPGESIYSTKPFIDPRTVSSTTTGSTTTGSTTAGGASQSSSYSSTPSTALSKKHGYKKQYTDMASKAKDYEAYVDRYADLSAAYRDIINNPNSKQAKYWLPRMANTSKKAFGMAHAGESQALQSKTYRGATKAMGKKARAVPNVKKKVVVKKTKPVKTPVKTTPVITQPSSGGGDVGSGTTETVLNIDPGQGGTSPIIPPLIDAVVVEGAESEIVQERVKDLINTNSPLFKAATTKALQSMNASGLVNSSMAQEAVMNSILAVAIPIAQADAQTFTEQRMANQNASNAFKAQQNAAYYQAFVARLNGQITQTLRALAEKAANWRAVLAERGRIAVTAGMSKEAAENALKTVTPTWF